MAASQTRSEVVAILRKRGVSDSVATIYADKLLVYREATENIEANGAIVTHPRTGEPMNNPYLAIRDRVAADLLKFRAVDASGLW